MISRSEALAKLYEWHHCAYFGAEAWTERGLIRSPDPIPLTMDLAKNTLVKALLNEVSLAVDDSQLIALVLEHLGRELDAMRYDTEEREFLADCFIEIANSLELRDFDARCDAWFTQRAEM